MSQVKFCVSFDEAWQYGSGRLRGGSAAFVWLDCWHCWTGSVTHNGQCLQSHARGGEDQRNAYASSRMSM